MAHVHNAKQDAIILGRKPAHGRRMEMFGVKIVVRKQAVVATIATGREGDMLLCVGSYKTVRGSNSSVLQCYKIEPDLSLTYFRIVTGPKGVSGSRHTNWDRVQRLMEKSDV